MTQTQQVPEHALQGAVTTELEWTPNVNSVHIGVSVNHGAVTLSGEVDSYPEKLNAERAAFSVHGVTAVAEDITVRDIFRESNDADLAREAGESLDRTVDVPPGSVKAAGTTMSSTCPA